MTYVLKLTDNALLGIEYFKSINDVSALKNRTSFVRNKTTAVYKELANPNHCTVIMQDIGQDG